MSSFTAAVPRIKLGHIVPAPRARWKQGRCPRMPWRGQQPWRYPVSQSSAGLAVPGTRPLRFSSVCWPAPSYCFFLSRTLYGTLALPVTVAAISLPVRPASRSCGRGETAQEATPMGTLVYTVSLHSRKSIHIQQHSGPPPPVPGQGGRLPGSCRGFPHARPIPIPPQLAKPSSADVSPEV